MFPENIMELKPLCAYNTIIFSEATPYKSGIVHIIYVSSDLGITNNRYQTTFINISLNNPLIHS